MRVLIRRPRREVELPGRRRVREILKELQINPETVIVVRGETLLTSDDVVAEEERIEVIPAISGGAR
jgi:sulfur carrier protein